MENKNHYKHSIQKSIVLFILSFLPLLAWGEITYTPSAVKAGFQVQFIFRPSTRCDLSGQVISWDFGDGMRTSGRNKFRVTHTYREAGNYKVKVIASGREGREACRVEESIEIVVQNLQCSGRLSIQPQPIYAGERVKFILFSARGTIFKASFDFGDGTSLNTTSSEVTHEYRRPGRYVVSVEGWARISEGECKVGPIRETIIVKEGKEVQAKITPTPSYPQAGEEVILKVISSATPINKTFKWNFGDGMEKEKENESISHTFIRPGTYRITVEGEGKLASGKKCKIKGALYLRVKPHEVKTEEIPKIDVKIENIGVFAPEGTPLPLIRGKYLAGDLTTVKLRGELVSYSESSVSGRLIIQNVESKEVYYQEIVNLAPSRKKKFEKAIPLSLERTKIRILFEKTKYRKRELWVTPSLLLAQKEVVIERKVASAPPYFKIAGFTFFIDSYKEEEGKIEGVAHTTIPFKFLKTSQGYNVNNMSINKDIPVQNIKDTGVFTPSQIPSSKKEYQGSTLPTQQNIIVAESGQVVYVDLDKIGYKNFVLDKDNNVIQGSFTLQLNAILDLDETKLLKLEKIDFSPQQAKGTFLLPLGANFEDKILVFEAFISPSLILYSGTLKLKGTVKISHPFGKDIELTLDPFSKIEMQMGKIVSSSIKGSIKISKFSPVVYQIKSGYFVFGLNKVGMLMDEIKSSSDEEITKDVFTEVIFSTNINNNTSSSSESTPWSNLPSMAQMLQGELAEIYLFTLKSQRMVADFSDFANFDFDQDPSWIGVALLEPKIMFPVELETVEDNKVIFKSNIKVDITQGEVNISGKFYKDGEETLTLLNPSGFKVRIKNGSYITLNNNLVQNAYSLMLVDLIFPEYLQSSNGGLIKISLDGMVPPSLKIDRKISYGGIICLASKPSVGITDLKMDIKIGKGTENKIKFEEGKIVYLPYYPGIFAPIDGSFEINTTGLWGKATNKNLEFETYFGGFPIGIKEFQAEFYASQIKELKIEGWAEFDALGGIKRPFIADLKMGEDKITIVKDLNLQEDSGTSNFSLSEFSQVYDGYFFEIDIKGGDIDKIIGANLSIDFKIKIFGFEKTYNLYNFKLTPTKILDFVFTIGDNWDFFGLKGMLPKGKIYTEGDKIVLEVKPKFTLGEGWLSFPMETKIKFKSNGEIESAKAGGNINIDLPQVKFKGKVKFSYDDKGVKISGDGDLKILESDVEVNGDFLYAHDTDKDYDYWKVYVKAAGFQIPLGVGMSIYGLGGGLAYNMKIETNPQDFSSKFTPVKDNFGFIIAADLGTDDSGYTFYSKGNLSITFNSSGSTGQIAMLADAWTFSENHTGKPPYKASFVFAWEDKTELMVTVGMKYEKSGIIKMPKGGGYNVGVFHADASGVEVKLGEKSNPWTAKFFNLLDGTAYLTLTVQSGYVGGTLGAGVSVKAEVSHNICVELLFTKPCCKVYAGVSGKANIDVVIDIYPDFQFDSTGGINVNAYAGCCIGKISLGLTIKTHISAPDPTDFSITITVPVDLWFWEGDVDIDLDII